MQKLFIILLIPLFILQCEDQTSETSPILLLEDFEDDSFSADGWSVIEYDVPQFRPNRLWVCKVGNCDTRNVTCCWILA